MLGGERGVKYTQFLVSVQRANLRSNQNVSGSQPFYWNWNKNFRFGTTLTKKHFFKSVCDHCFGFIGKGHELMNSCMEATNIVGNIGPFCVSDRNSWLFVHWCVDLVIFCCLHWLFLTHENHCCLWFRTLQSFISHSEVITFVEVMGIVHLLFVFCMTLSQFVSQTVSIVSQ